MPSQLKLSKGEMEFRVSENASNESLSTTVIKKGQRLADGSWHQVHLVYGQDGVSLAVDYRRPEYRSLHQTNLPSLTIDDDSLITIGVGYFDSQPGKEKFSLKIQHVIVICFFFNECVRRFYRLHTRSHYES